MDVDLETDEQDFFGVKPEQRTLFQEGVCRPGWIEGMPLPAAAPLYTPNDLTERVKCRRSAMAAHARWFDGREQ